MMKGWKLLLGAIAIATLSACGSGGNANNTKAQPPSGNFGDPDGNGSAPQLQGTWHGSARIADPDKGAVLHRASVTFNATGDITEVSVDNNPEAVASVVDSVTRTTDAGYTLYTYTDGDGSRQMLVVDAEYRHAVLFGQDDSAVLQKGVGKANADAAAGDWTGSILSVGSSAKTLHIGKISAHFSGSSTLGGSFNTDSCSDLTATVGRPGPYGTYRQGTITGGQGDDCRSQGSRTFQIMLSNDADFMLIGFSNGKPIKNCPVQSLQCGLAILQRQSGKTHQPRTD